ncbi:MAG TPA: thiamine phosphate synthase [Candidatus Angelobacter sp.]|jgi:thiamine-phosphate pyrophosphorylase|nr:thiamine phosphate synthase [Candidatus Angelobacter sp.]
MLFYYITDRSQFSGSEHDKRRQLLNKIAECVTAGVHYIQLREKDLTGCELQKLAEEANRLVAQHSGSRLLINSRIDVALACLADGVHLPAHDMPASEARAIFGRTGQALGVIGVSCHTTDEVAFAEAHGADFAVFGPVFEKNGLSHRAGLESLEKACSRTRLAAKAMPVLALGGITLENALRCRQAGAAGIAAIRMFQQNDVADVITKLRSSGCN